MKTNIVWAIRNMNKNRINTGITMAGLSVAFACLLLIYLYVSQEYGYNQFHINGERIYRANYTLTLIDGGTAENFNYYDPRVAAILKEKVPGIKRSTAFRSAHSPVLKFENQYFQEDIYITEPDFFGMFSFELIVGNKSQIMTAPNEIVITSSLADKFSAIKSCTSEELLGQPVFFQNTGDQPFVISGILEDVPKNSSLQFDALIPYHYERSFRQSNNLLGNSTIFYEVRENADAQSAETEVSKTVSELYNDKLNNLQARKILVNSPDAFVPYSVPLKKTYLNDIKSDYESNNSQATLHVLSAIGLLILVIAVINYILLSLGQSLTKASEIGVRKILGAKKGNLLGLFLTEGIVITVGAMIIGTILCSFGLPVFNALAPNDIHEDLIDVPGATVFGLAVAFFVVLLTSSVSVLRLGRLKPTLPGSLVLGPANKYSFTRMFIVLQYGLSILLIIAALAIVRQTNYMKYKDLGFTSGNILNLTIYHLSDGEKQILKNQLEAYVAIERFTFTDRNYVSGKSTENIVNEVGENIAARILRIDENYVPMLNLEMIMGRNFDDQDGDHTVIVNEKLLSHYRFRDDPIGRTINVGGQVCQIIGVVKDHHFDSMKDEIQPLVFLSNTNQTEQFLFAFIKYQPAQLSEVMSFVKNLWSDVAPGKELELNFWDEQLNRRYQTEEKWSRIIGYAAVIAIIISSLGLFALTLLMLNRRVKEIGIRKVNGAKVWEVMALLTKDFVKWVLIAFVVATPLAWYAMNKWLENFAYKTELSWWVFALAGLVAMGIALLTVSWQSWKAATGNPVNALRYE